MVCVASNQRSSLCNQRFWYIVGSKNCSQETSECKHPATPNYLHMQWLVCPVTSTVATVCLSCDVPCTIVNCSVWPTTGGLALNSSLPIHEWIETSFSPVLSYNIYNANIWKVEHFSSRMDTLCEDNFFECHLNNCVTLPLRSITVCYRAVYVFIQYYCLWDAKIVLLEL